MRWFYIIKVLSIEVFCCIAIVFTVYMLKEDLILPNWWGDKIDLDTFINAAEGFNSSLVFAMFLSVFMSDSERIKDLKRHPSSRQPVVIILVNSLFLTLLALQSTSIFWIQVCLIAITLVFTLFNMHYAWKLLKIRL